MNMNTLFMSLTVKRRFVVKPFPEPRAHVDVGTIDTLKYKLTIKSFTLQEAVCCLFESSNGN